MSWKRVPRAIGRRIVRVISRDAVRVNTVGNLKIMSAHPVLFQVASDIALGINTDNLPNRPVNIYLGTHRKFGLSIFSRCFRIGIQTEQLYDENGQKLWRRQRRWRLLKYLIAFHAILDLSHSNVADYQWLPHFLRKKVYFGPYIFPCDSIPYRRGSGRYVFVGALNDRRREVLERLPRDYCDVYTNVYGGRLSSIINTSRGVANIHFAEGTYTEYPRLLSAYIAGKPVISEMLSQDLSAGDDYIVLGEEVDESELAKVFSTFSNGFAAQHKLTSFIQEVMRGRYGG